MQENALPPQNTNPVRSSHGVSASNGTNPTSNSTNKKEIKGFTLLKMGILEIAFVGVVLLLFFGILNYFNILSVSKAFPEYLSWLPRQETQTNLQTNSALQNTPAPLPTVSSEEKAKEILSNLLSKNLTSSTLPPESIKVTASEIEENAFDSTWEINGTTVSSHFKLSSSQQSISYLMLSIIIPGESTPSGSLAQQITPQFFSIILGNTWDCKIKDSLTFCENFWQEPDGTKKGIALHDPIIITSGNKEAIRLSFCEFSKDSPQNGLDSCFR